MHQVRHMCFCNPFRCTITCACSSNLIFAHYTPRKSINVLKCLNDLCFFKLKRPSFGNICSPRDNLTCIIVAVDSRCVCVCVWGVGVAGNTLRVVSHCVGWLFCETGATSESWIRYLKHYTTLSYIHVLATCSRWLSYTTLDTRVWCFLWAREVVVHHFDEQPAVRLIWPAR